MNLTDWDQLTAATAVQMAYDAYLAVRRNNPSGRVRSPIVIMGHRQYRALKRDNLILQWMMTNVQLGDPPPPKDIPTPRGCRYIWTMDGVHHYVHDRIDCFVVQVLLKELPLPKIL